MNLKKLNYVLFVLVLGAFASCDDTHVNTTDDTRVNSTYTVTYDGNGSNTGSSPTDSNNYEQGATVTVASIGDLVKTGSTFTAWNTAADGSGTVRAAGSTFSIGTESVTLYAQWAANPTYMVTYNGNGGTGTAPNDSNNYEEGATVTVASVGDLVKAGKIFTGWNTAADGSGIARAAGSTFSIGTESVTLYAQWTTPL